MIKKNNINIYFILFLFLHLVVWTLAPTFSNVNLPLDTIEALAWGSNLDWGFNKHPPVSAFVVEIIYKIFGNQDWAYYLLSQIFVIASLYFVWRLSDEFLKSKIHSLISVLILEGVVFFNYTTPEFNVYVCQLPFKVLTVYFCWKSISNNKILNWIYFGLFASIGFLTHYSFIFLLLSLIIYFIFKFISEKKFIFKCLISILIFLILLLPHLIWLYENNFITISYALNRTGIEENNLINHLLNPLKFIIKQVLMLTPLIIMFLLLLSKNKQKLKINLKNNKLLFLICINILPIIIIFFISFFTGAKIRTMWMSTSYLFLGILLLFLYEKKIDLKKFKNFLFLLVFIFFTSPMVYLYISLTNNLKRTDYPGKEISRLVQNKWNQNFINEISIVVGDEWFAGNLSYHLSSRPKWFNSLDGNILKINKNEGVIYAGNPKILKEICPGVFGEINPVGYCMIGIK